VFFSSVISAIHSCLQFIPPHRDRSNIIGGATSNFAPPPNIRYKLHYRNVIVELLFSVTLKMEPKIQDTFVKAVEFQITSLTRFYLLSA